MKDNLRVVNVIATGKIPTKKRIDFERLFKRSKMLWEIVNEDISPICMTRILRGKKDLNAQGKRKAISVAIWATGTVNICGSRSLKDARKAYNKVVRELRRTKAIC